MKTKFLLVTLALAPMLLVACGNSVSDEPTSLSSESGTIFMNPLTPTPPADDAPPPGDLDTPPAIQELSDRAPGMDEKELESEAVRVGATVRVTSRDGEEFAVTMDYISTRINIKVQDGIIISSSTG